MEGKTMIFRKLGGRYQFMIDTPEDLKSILKLDEALWMCTGAPIDSFTCDPAFLNHIDSDINGRVRTDEVKKAVAWAIKVLSDLNVLSSNFDEFPLNAINTSNDAGKQLRSSAELILSNIGIKEKETIKLEHTRSRKDILSSGECNGDGVIPVVSVTDEKIQHFISHIMETTGEALDASGNKGITSEHLDKFLEDSKAYIEWYDKGKLKKGEKSSLVMVWGEDTVPAYSAIKSVKDKIDEYFSQCRLLKVDPVAVTRFHATEKTIQELDTSNTEAVNLHIANAPLSEPNIEEQLALDSNINPHFRNQIETFRENVLQKTESIKSDSEISFDEWEKLKKEFANFAEWEAGKPGETVETLGADVIRKYLKGKLPEKLRPIFEKDLAVAEEIKKIGDVEKLLLYSKYLLAFTNNFVSLSSLFNPESFSMIQVGKLIMDGRHFDLNLKVKDRNKHKKVAIKSNICVMYLKISSQDGEKMLSSDVATAVTSGNIRNLYIGKMGVFFTPDGKEWDAEVIDFVQQPVSIIEALKMPFTKLGGFLKKQTEKFTSSTYNKIESGVGASVTNVEKSIQAPPQAKPAQGKTSWTGPLMLLGGGIGIAGLGSAFASVINALKDNTVILKISLFILGVIIIVAIPIIISAILKLRRRNIGMFLEACGWSINTSMRLNIKMGLLFTRIPAFPENSDKKLFDYTRAFLKKTNFQKKSWKFRLFIIVMCIVLSLALGYAVNTIFKIDKKILNWFGWKSQGTEECNSQQNK